MKRQRVVMTFLVTVFVCGSVPPLAKAQSSSGAGTSSRPQPHNHRLPPTPSPARHIKSRRMARRSRNYVFDAFGPYAIIGSAVAAGINQASGDKINGTGSGTPPEWGGGTGPYFERFASNYGINITATTARYMFAQVLGEDTIYYRCECSGFSHRSGAFALVHRGGAAWGRRTLSLFS